MDFIRILFDKDVQLCLPCKHNANVILGLRIKFLKKKSQTSSIERSKMIGKKMTFFITSDLRSLDSLLAARK